MKCLAFVAVVALLLALASPAAAGFIYDATGTFQDGATLSGTMTLNDTGGLVATALKVTLGGTVVFDSNLGQGVLFNQVTGADGKTYDHLEVGNAGVLPFLQLFWLPADFPGSSPVPFVLSVPATGGTAFSEYEAVNSVNRVHLSSGQLTPETAISTPEPASLTLLGIGAVGLLGYGWRRRRRAAA
jgi:hypothetical protein